MLDKWQIAEARAVAIGKQAFKLAALELNSNCDGKNNTCDLWKLGVGCTVGYCRRVEI